MIVDHVVVAITDAFDDLGERPDLDLEPGLLANLARDRGRHELARLDPPAGHRPRANTWRLASLNDEHAFGREHDRADGDLWCHVRARAGFAFGFFFAGAGAAFFAGCFTGEAMRTSIAVGHTGASTQWS